MARKSTKSASVVSNVVATLPADLKSITKPVVKDALRAAARVLGGAWGFVEKSENDTVYTIRREADGAALTAKRVPGSPVTLTGAAPTPVEVKPKAEAKPVEPPKADKPKAGKAKAETPKADAPKAKAKPVEGKGAVVAPVVKGKGKASAKADAKPVEATPAEKAHAEVVPF